MGLVLIGFSLAVGWLGWSWWLSVPLGLLFYIQTYRENPGRAARVAPTAWILGPLYALLFIWIGSLVHDWFSY
jgi:hypothetical protein